MISRLEEPIIFPTEEQIDTYTHSKNVPLKVGSDLRPLERGVFDLSELNEEISPVRYFWTKNGDTIVVASEEMPTYLLDFKRLRGPSEEFTSNIL